MSTEDNKARMQRYYEEVWQQCDLSASADVVADAYVDHNPLPGLPPGRAGHDLFVQQIHTTFPDLHFTFHHLVAEGDKVVGYWSMQATQQGEIFGIPASGRPVNMSGIDIARFENGKIVELWHIEDTLGMLQQIGAIPAPGQVPA